MTPKYAQSMPYHPKPDKRHVSPSVKKPEETIPGCPSFIPANLPVILLLYSIVFYCALIA